jgi:hypothetical protein
MYKKLFEFYFYVNLNTSLCYKLKENKYDTPQVSKNKNIEMINSLRNKILANEGKIERIQVKYLGKNQDNRTIVASDPIKVRIKCHLNCRKTLK